MSQIDFKKVKARIANIRVKGLQRTKDEYVQKQFGNIFSSTTNFEELLNETNELKKRLVSLGCFKRVEVLIDASKSGEKDSFEILLDVEEHSKISGGIHTSIGNNEGSLNTAISFPNLFGGGERLSTEYAQGTNNHIDYRLSYNSPISMNPKNQFATSVYRSSNDYSWSKYKQNDTGIIVDTMFPFRHLLFSKFDLKGSHSFTYEASWRQLVSSLDAAFQVREQSGHSLKSSLKYTNIIDRRDNKVLPNEGGFLKTSVEVAGLGGDVRFLKADSDYQYSRTFFNYFTTQFSFSNGFITPLKSGERISILDKYFLGGPLSLRGFTNRGAGPHVDDCSLGNNAYWLFAAHLYTPLPFLHNHKSLSSWFRTHSFVNIGNLLSIEQLINERENRVKQLTNNCRLSVGTGLVIAFGNIARVELNYVWPIWKIQSDKAINGLQFGIGVNFN